MNTDKLESGFRVFHGTFCSITCIKQRKYGSHEGLIYRAHLPLLRWYRPVHQAATSTFSLLFKSISHGLLSCLGTVVLMQRCAPSLVPSLAGTDTHLSQEIKTLKTLIGGETTKSLVLECSTENCPVSTNMGLDFWNWEMQFLQTLAAGPLGCVLHSMTQAQSDGLDWLQHGRKARPVPICTHGILVDVPQKG